MSLEGRADPPPWWWCLLCICVVCSILVWLSSLIVCRQVPQNNFKMRLKTLLFAPHWLAPHPFPFLSPADLLASCCSPTYNTHNIQRGPCRLCSSPSSSSSLLEAPHQWDDCLMLLRCAAHRHHCAACCPSAPCRRRATHLRAAPCHCRAARCRCSWLGKSPTCRRHVGPTAKSRHFWPTLPSRADTNLFPTLFFVLGIADFLQIFSKYQRYIRSNHHTNW